MQPSSFISAKVVIPILAVVMTFASLLYIQPGNCQTMCIEPEGAPCPTGACREGEQKAGFPLPVLQDQGTGGSPTSGWGVLGSEDLPNPLYFLLDVVFYGLLFWLAWQVIQVIRFRKKSAAFLKVLPAVLLVFAFLLIGLKEYGVIFYRNPAEISSQQPENALLGNWKAANDATGGELIFHFYPSGKFSISVAETIERYNGQYNWNGTDTIHLNLKQQVFNSMGEVHLCAQLPSIIRDICHSGPAVQEPTPNYSAYPIPINQIEIAPSLPYPAPTAEPFSIDQVDVELKIEISGDTMVLSQPSGALLRFERMKIN
jgi:hypothetical protein